MVSCRKDSKLRIKTGTQIVISYIILHENAELLVVAHQGATDAASVLDTGTAQFALRIGKVADALRIALYVALLGGLSDAQHDLPPLVEISRNGRPAVLYRFASLIFY